MTWAVYTRDFGGPIHISGSFEGARRWFDKFTTEDKAEFKHIAPDITPADALILFRMFLKQTGYHHGLITAKYIADAFNDYLHARHPMTLESISTQRMSRILRDWGATGRRVNSSVKRWFLTLQEICLDCGGHVRATGHEAVCAACGKTVVLT